MGWVTDKGGSAVQKFDDGGEVKKDVKIKDGKFDEDAGRKGQVETYDPKTKKHTVDTVVQVNTPEGKRYYEHSESSRDSGTARAESLSGAQLKYKAAPSDSLTTKDYKLKYKDLDKPKKDKKTKKDKPRKKGPMSKQQEKKASSIIDRLRGKNKK